MSSFSPNTTSSSDDINLIMLFKVLISYWRRIAAISVILTLISSFFILQMKDSYKSYSLIRAVDEDQGISSLLSQYSGIASMAGINVATEADNGDIAVAKINSREFFNHLISFDGVLPNIIAAKEYDKKNKKVIFNENIYNSEKGAWLDGEPSIEKAYDIYKKQMLWIRKTGDTKFISITIKHISPEFSHRMITLIFDEINNLTREKDRRETSESLAYLEGLLPNTKIKDIKETISNIIKTQIQKNMLSKIRENYFLEYLDKPVVPENPDSLSKKVLLALSFLLNLIISSLACLIRFYFGRNL